MSLIIEVRDQKAEPRGPAHSMRVGSPAEGRFLSRPAAAHRRRKFRRPNAFGLVDVRPEVGPDPAFGDLHEEIER